jgi:hypothetical protein
MTRQFFSSYFPSPKFTLSTKTLKTLALLFSLSFSCYSIALGNIASQRSRFTVFMMNEGVRKAQSVKQQHKN